MKHRLVLAIVFALSSLGIQPAISDIKNGTQCKKLGVVKTLNNIQYTCIKTGNRKVWSKSPKSKPSSSKSSNGRRTPITPWGQMEHRVDYLPPIAISGNPKTLISDTSELASISDCKIRDGGVAGVIQNNPQRHFVSGFPNYPERANFNQNATLQFVAVDFVDLPGKRKPAVDLEKITTFLKDFFESQTHLDLALKFRIPADYIRMPKPVQDYGLAQEFFGGSWSPISSFEYVKEAVKISDPIIDFSGAKMFAVVVPPEVTRKQIAAFVAQSGEPGQQIYTNEGEIYNFLLMAGPIGSESYELLNWAHELGHLFGMTDIRNTVNVSRQDSSDLGMLDLMNSMIAPELLAWQRFIMGLLTDDQVRCVTTSKPLTHRIVPVAQPENLTKMVVIPTGEFKAIAIESRRSHGFDQNLGSLNEGIFVYSIDTTVPYRYSTMKLIPSPTSTDSMWRRDAALKIGESVTYEGWRISYIETGSFGDVIKTERVGVK